ncbi:MAG: hypothetical protein H0U17_07115 [Actinobacteria bacterium]|nr:hypothetical protein [Actinomycetota bacterium]
MQETKIRTSGDDDPPTERPQWVRLVAIALAIALVAGLLIAAIQGVTSSGADPDPNPGGAAGTNPQPDFSLTDEEAIERFQELEHRQIEAYRQADITLVSDFAGPGPFKDQVVRELRKMRKDDVTAVLRSKGQELLLVRNESTEITIQETATIDIQFLDEAGRNVTTKGEPQRLVIEWQLEPFDTGWLITESVAVESVPLG